jgi:hypothetical protein
MSAGTGQPNINSQALGCLKITLTLAVQGKLVHQDPKDEPIPKPPPLRLSKAGAPGTERKTPFQVPNGWIWTRLGQVGELVNGDRSKNYPNKADYASKFNKSSPCRRQSTTKSSSVRRSKSDVTNVLSVSMSACASGKA